ncbi:hypothetical protein B0H16DRAFT_1514188 [Mycena metata]|uniref:Uncharacterized protein n=1 Tax=Mycena metata TaxID=1033252 RepID=A0AAD7NQY0_9AGAR|nr:hypothetical protein B0H16DRAFT_1514188 [Mycena metata]
MLSDMGDAEAAREHSLLVHIRHLLLNYAVTHITTDYIQLTNRAVVDLWNQYFVEIPTADPHSLTLPTDPFETLTRLHALGSCEPFQEKFQSTPGAIQYIKKLIKPQPGKPKSERVAFEESQFESYVPICPPFCPVLTTRAMRETPKPKAGPTKFRASLPPSHSEFVSSQGIRPVDVEPISEPSVKQDDVLCTNWRLRPEEQDAVRSFLRPILGRCPKEYRNPYLLEPSLRPDTPPRPSRVPEPAFIPIFPRRRRARSGIREGDPPPSGLKGIASLPTVILPQVKVEELEPELHRRNMVVVDGWHTLKSSPSPTPSPSSSQETDQLLPSPDTTPPPPRPAKMEVVQIPRVRRIGGARKKPPPIGPGENLGTFLVPLLPKPPAANPPLRLSPEPTASMLGQADSACESMMDVDLPDLDVEVGGLYGNHRKDPGDLILKEKLDEKRQLLMEVPVLPPPNEHPPNALFLPSFLGDFVAPLKAKGQIITKNLAHQFLKKAKGIPSLNVELSWVPIAAKTRIPTHSEIIKVTSLLDMDSGLPDQIAALLQGVPATISASELPAYSDSWSRRYRNIYPETEELDPELARCEIILSRKERRRMAGLPDEVQDDAEDSDNAMDTEEPLMGEDRSAKRPRLSQDPYLNDSGIAFDAPDYHDGPVFYDDTEIYLNDGDKENLPPYDPGYDDSADCHEEFDPQHPATVIPVHSASQDSLDMGFAYEPREFVALSFEESLAGPSAQPTQTRPSPDEPPSDETYAGMFEPHPNAVINDYTIHRPPSPPPPAPEIATRSLGIAEFAKLRAKKVTIPNPESPTSAQTDANTNSTHFKEPSHTIPDHIYDRNTLRLPTTWTPPDTLHRYMVSMELVQKQGLLRSLRSRSCSIDLVERDSLGGVDIILDPHTAIIYTNLLVLPSACADLALLIVKQSWLYARLLVVFEAYPASHSYQAKANCNTASELFAYSPPVLKALGKLRRDVGIAEGYGKKCPACVVQYAFADTVNEAALFTRYFGDFAEANDDSRGVIWGDRTWLDDDVPEGEQDLAAADGMNRFAAFLILCQIDLGEFLELTPEARVEKFSAFVGVERMDLLNQVIEQRLQAMQPSDSEMDTSVVTTQS